MSAHIQIIERDGKPEYAVVPIEEYNQLLAKAEDNDDIRAANEVIANENDESVTHDLVKQLVDGANPVKTWRKHRKMTQAALAERAGVTQAYIVMIEKGERTGSVDLMKNIAEALAIDMDDLLGWN